MFQFGQKAHFVQKQLTTSKTHSSAIRAFELWPHVKMAYIIARIGAPERIGTTDFTLD